MKKMMKGLILCFAAMMMFSCKGTDISGKWNIISVNGETVTVVGDKMPFIEFNTEESRINGNTGCNIMNGAYTFSGKSLTFGNMATTMMAGPEENMKTERAVLNALGNVAEVSSEKGKLILKDSDGKVVMELAK